MNRETTCSIVRDLLPGYVENLTGERTNAFVSAHLAECAECRAAHRAMTGRLNGEEIKTQEMLKNMKRRRRIKRARTWAAVLGLTMAAAVCLLPLPRHISRTYQAVEWRSGGGETAAPRAVTIEGYYMDYLFRQDRFDGSIAVEGYPITEQTLSTCRFNGGTALLAYYAQEPLPAFGYDEAGTLYFFGQLMMEPGGGSFAILVFENHGWSGENGLVIAGPAARLDDAADIARGLGGKCTPPLTGTGI